MKTKNDKPTNEEQIRRLVNNWAKAIRARDMEGALAYHAKDVVMFDVPLPLQSKGIEAYKMTWNLFFDSNPGGKGSFELRELKITAEDTVGFLPRTFDNPRRKGTAGAAHDRIKKDSRELDDRPRTSLLPN